MRAHRNYVNLCFKNQYKNDTKNARNRFKTSVLHNYSCVVYARFFVFENMSNRENINQNRTNYKNVHHFNFVEDCFSN